MAWALQFDGVNDVATSSSTLVKSTAYEFLFKFTYKENGYICAPFAGRGIGITNANVIDIYGSSQQVFFNIGTTISVGDQLEVRFLWTDNGNSTYELNLQVNINDAGFSGNLSVYIGSKTFSALIADRTMDFGRRPNTVFTSVDWLFFKYIEAGVTLNNWDATASSHAAGTPILTDTVGGNDATGVNMPTDGSAWIDLGGGGGGLTLVVSSIASGESFGLPDVILNTAYLLPSAITTAESFGVPTVASLDQFIQAISVSSLEAFGEPLILTGGVTLAPTSITSQESLGTPFLVYSQLVLVDSITSEESFGIAIISDGVALVIPVGDRDTYQKIAEYLRATDKFVSYQNNEILLEWLRSEGIDEGSFNDSFKEYWGRKGYVGAYNDRWREWRDS